MTMRIRVQLCLMMFLQFFIWGGWFVTLGTFMGNTLGASATDIGAAFSTQSWGAILAPLVIGVIADRYFNAERILGLLHLLGAVLMYLMATSQDVAEFYPYVLAYMLAYMPTLALVNTVAFRQMRDPAREFSLIRVFGTIGWIVAGLLISAFAWDSGEGIRQGLLRNTFLMCAVASVVHGLLSLLLPATPPQAGKQPVRLGQLLALDALALLKDRNFLVFFLCSVLICIPLAFYYQNLSPFLTELGVSNSTAKASIGQVSEVLFMLLLPLFLKRFGFKLTLLVGMLCWAARYLLFAYGNADELAMMLLLGIALHGLCYDFFFVTGQIYTDSKAGKAFQASAQGLLTLATYGVGMLIGFKVAGLITDIYQVDGGHQWQQIWQMPVLFALLVTALFALLFKQKRVQEPAGETVQRS